MCVRVCLASLRAVNVNGHLGYQLHICMHVHLYMCAVSDHACERALKMHARLEERERAWGRGSTNRESWPSHVQVLLLLLLLC